MRTRFLSILLALSLLWPASALAQKSKANMLSEITANIPNNTVGSITPAIVRTTLTDMLNSWQQYAFVNPQTGTTYTIQASDYGQFVTTSNGAAVAVTLPQATGSFQYFNFFFRNLGVGTATITPQGGSTINGAASLAVVTNQSYWVVSDGANYQVFIGGGSSASAGGSSGQVQWNSSGSLGGITGWTTNGTTGLTGGASTTLAIGNASLAGNVLAMTGSALINGPAIISSVNKVTFTAPATGSTLTIADGKTLTANASLTLAGTDGKTLTISNSLTLAGTDGTTLTFPNASSTIPRVVASGAKALNNTPVASATCSSAQTDTATGTLTTDAPSFSFNANPSAVAGYVPLTSGMLTIIPYPTADTINFLVCNNTAATITPGNVTINWRVIR